MDSVPFLSSQQIQARALSVANRFDDLPEDNAWCRMSRVIEQLRRWHVGYSVRDLRGDGTEDALGYFDFEQRCIVVDREVSSSDQWPFVVAHELGHLVLHRKLRLHAHHMEPGDLLRDMVTGRPVFRSAHDKIEYQATQFGLAFALPKESILKALISIQRDLGIARNLGRIYVDHQPRNWDDFHRILFALRNSFEIDRHAIKLRLFQLGSLVIQDRAEYEHVSRFYSRKATQRRKVVLVPPTRKFTPARSKGVRALEISLA